MKKKLALLLACSICAATPIATCADEKDDKIIELEAQVAELQATIEDLQKQLEETKQTSTNQKEYAIGDSWIVEGQWKLTIDSVEEVADRNEYADTTPAAVYLVTYTYENLGYEDDIMDGLYIDIADGIIDSTGKMGYAYPGDITKYPQETPVGAICEAQTCIGVDNAGDFKINYSNYDGNSVKQNTFFNITVQ